jgi:hypothetical protein
VAPFVGALLLANRDLQARYFQITTLQLSRVAMSRPRQRAEAIDVNEAKLASDLLEVIALDDLYDAVLDKALYEDRIGPPSQ